MNWKTFIERQYASLGNGMSRPAFRSPASPDEIANLESAVGGRLPNPLRDCLYQSNGILDELLIQGQWIENIWLVWSCCEMMENNLPGNRVGIPADYLVFAAAGADGILFGCRFQPEPGGDSPVYTWHPYESVLEKVEPSIPGFLARRIGGSIFV